MSTPASTPAMRDIKVFLIVWLGQLLSLVGSGLTNFALGIWVYQQTASIFQFALVIMCRYLPGILVAPLAGVVVDRYDRRWVMLLSDAGAAISTLVLAIIVVGNQLEISYIYFATIISAGMRAFQEPAYMASVTLLVPQAHRARANALVESSQGMTHLVAPVLAGMLFLTIHLWGIMLIDVATFLISSLILLLVRIPRPMITSDSVAARQSFFREAAYGLTYIIARPGLFGILIFFCIGNFIVGLWEILLAPLVLSFASTQVLGEVWSAAGIGILLGSAVMVVWGGPRRQVRGIYGFALIMGLSLFCMGLRPSAWLIGIANGCLMGAAQISGSCSQAIWQSNVPPDVQGRVFATQNMVGFLALPLAYLSAGPLADNLFTPLLTVDGVLANTVGMILGVGTGRGIGLLFVVMGACFMLLTVASFLYPPTRQIDDEPSAVIDESDLVPRAASTR